MNKFVGLVAVGAVVIAAPFFISGPDGKPMANLDFVSQQLDKGLQPLEAAGDKLKSAIPAQETNSDASSGIYKWQDANGNWHYGDKAVAGSERMEIDLDQNIVDLPEAKSPAKASQTPSSSSLSDSSKVGDIASAAFGTSGSGQSNDGEISSNPLERIKDAADITSEYQNYADQAAQRERDLRNITE